jgi:hypothetical protein
VKESSLLYKDRAVRSPEDEYKLLKDFLADADREHFIVVALDTKNQPVSINICHIGSLNASIVHPREVMKSAILSNAASIIVGREGEYLNEIRDNTVIGRQRAGIALGNSGGTKNKHDASGPGNWVHSNDLIGNRQGVLVILGTPDTLIEDRNAPGTELRGKHITGGMDGFWAIRLNEDRGADGRGKGIPSGIRIECNVIRQAANGIRIDAREVLRLVGNVVEGIDGAELRVADEIEVSRSVQLFPIETQRCES